MLLLELRKVNIRMLIYKARRIVDLVVDDDKYILFITMLWHVWVCVFLLRAVSFSHWRRCLHERWNLTVLSANLCRVVRTCESIETRLFLYNYSLALTVVSTPSNSSEAEASTPTTGVLARICQWRYLLYEHPRKRYSGARLGLWLISSLQRFPTSELLCYSNTWSEFPENAFRTWLRSIPIEHNN